MYEIWWLETVGGHHWIAKRVPDSAYVTMPNQLGIDEFDLDDALGEQSDHMCSADLGEFIERNHLDLSVEAASPFNPRDAFGSHSDSDHVYNTPRAWWMQRFLNPYDEMWDGQDADHRPENNDIPWARQPERKVTIEDIKYVLSGHYQGTPYDPYGKLGDERTRHMYRPIGINRQSQLAVMQLRPYRPQAYRAIQWMAYGSNPGSYTHLSLRHDTRKRRWSRLWRPRRLDDRPRMRRLSPPSSIAGMCMSVAVR